MKKIGIVVWAFEIQIVLYHLAQKGMGIAVIITAVAEEEGRTAICIDW